MLILYFIWLLDLLLWGFFLRTELKISQLRHWYTELLYVITDLIFNKKSILYLITHTIKFNCNVTNKLNYYKNGVFNILNIMLFFSKNAFHLSIYNFILLNYTLCKIIHKQTCFNNFWDKRNSRCIVEFLSSNHLFLSDWYQTVTLFVIK